MKKWKGTFTSGAYNFLGLYTPIYGEMETELGEEGSTYEAPCSLIYKGSYKYGQVFHGTLHSTEKGFVAKINQSVATFGITSRTNNKITGTYGVEKPYDYGTFELTLVED